MQQAGRCHITTGVALACVGMIAVVPIVIPESQAAPRHSMINELSLLAQTGVDPAVLDSLGSDLLSPQLPDADELLAGLGGTPTDDVAGALSGFLGNPLVMVLLPFLPVFFFGPLFASVLGSSVMQQLPTALTGGIGDSIGVNGEMPLPSGSFGDLVTSIFAPVVQGDETGGVNALVDAIFGGPGSVLGGLGLGNLFTAVTDGLNAALGDLNPGVESVVSELVPDLALLF